MIADNHKKLLERLRFFAIMVLNVGFIADFCFGGFTTVAAEDPEPDQFECWVWYKTGGSETWRVCDGETQGHNGHANCWITFPNMTLGHIAPKILLLKTKRVGYYPDSFL